jgi:hypothetical protein
MKKILATLLFLASFSCFATTAPAPTCAKAPPVTSDQFCVQFKSIAQCHCMADGGLPAGMCQDMEVIYKRMKAAFGSQEAACLWQEQHGSPERTTYQDCMNDWYCYREGGDHDGLCSGTGKRC